MAHFQPRPHTHIVASSSVCFLYTPLRPWTRLRSNTKMQKELDCLSCGRFFLLYFLITWSRFCTDEGQQVVASSSKLACNGSILQHFWGGLTFRYSLTTCLRSTVLLGKGSFKLIPPGSEGRRTMLNKAGLWYLKLWIITHTFRQSPSDSGAACCTRIINVNHLILKALKARQ